MAFLQVNAVISTVVTVLFVIAMLTSSTMAYPAYGEYYQTGYQQPYYNPYAAISGNYGYSSWDASVVNHLLF
uniref:Nematode cuticle collagen N-terminal domain-containing protein n=1 Tax=Panagrellus redivivus TaxID=6233 RepID=A0A7E4UZZ6_PANRE